MIVRNSLHRQVSIITNLDRSDHAVSYLVRVALLINFKGAPLLTQQSAELRGKIPSHT